MTNPAMTPLSTLAPRTATDQIFDVLYSAVISLQLPPGTKVSEAELAKQLDVSRQPVRDAFFRLSKLGFLSIRPQRATQVTRISEKAVLDAAFVRTAIEAECLRHCAKHWNETHSRQLHAESRPANGRAERSRPKQFPCAGRSISSHALRDSGACPCVGTHPGTEGAHGPGPVSDTVRKPASGGPCGTYGDHRRPGRRRCNKGRAYSTGASRRNPIHRADNA